MRIQALVTLGACAALSRAHGDHGLAPEEVERAMSEASASASSVGSAGASAVSSAVASTPIVKPSFTVSRARKTQLPGQANDLSSPFP